MNTRPILGVDLDSTLADIMPVFCQLVKEQYNKDVKVEEIDHWDFWDHIVGEDKWRLFREVWARWKVVEPTEPDIASKLYKAIGRGYEIAIITSTQKENVPYVHRWLDRHGIPYKSLVALFSHQSKTEYPWNALVDDNPSLPTKVMAEPNRHRRLFLFDQPWNRAVDHQYRVKSLDEVIQEL